jgi:hypothetical protein
MKLCESIFNFLCSFLLKGVAEAQEHCTMKMIHTTSLSPYHRVGTVKSLRQGSANLPNIDHSRNQGAIPTVLMMILGLYFHICTD